MEHSFLIYQQNSAILIRRKQLGLAETEVAVIADLIAVFQALPNSPLATAFAGSITIHLPAGISRAVSGLADLCFANADQNDTTLSPSLPLSGLRQYGKTADKPLIIKSSQPQGNYILKLMLPKSILPHLSPLELCPNL